MITAAWKPCPACNIDLYDNPNYCSDCGARIGEPLIPKEPNELLTREPYDEAINCV